MCNPKIFPFTHSSVFLPGPAFTSEYFGCSSHQVGNLIFPVQFHRLKWKFQKPGRHLFFIMDLKSMLNKNFIFTPILQTERGCPFAICCHPSAILLSSVFDFQLCRQARIFRIIFTLISHNISSLNGWTDFLAVNTSELVLPRHLAEKCRLLIFRDRALCFARLGKTS